MFLLNLYLQKNDLNTFKVIHCDVIRSFVGVYDCIHPKVELLTLEVIFTVNM